MPRLSIARSVRLAVLGLTLALTAVAGVGVAKLYDARQRYEDRLAQAYGLQASAGKLLAAGVVEEATLRTARGRTGRIDRARGRGGVRRRRRPGPASRRGRPRERARRLGGDRRPGAVASPPGVARRPARRARSGGGA